MSRSRNIKPGFFKNEDLAECSFAARLCFAGLWTLADREGRLEDRPKRIKGELFAFDSIEVEPLLQELVSRGGFILRYQVGDQALIQILNFHKHQNPHHREAPSVLPAPDGWAEQPQEPEASGSSHDGKAPGEPQASPGLSPQDVSFHDGKAVLIPDSGFLIPDSLQSDSLHTSDHPSEVSDVSTTPPKSSKKPRASKSRDAHEHLADLLIDVDDQVKNDWLKVRKAKKVGPLTRTAMEQFAAEAGKAGLSINEAMRYCCGKSWAGFNASWYQGHETNTRSQSSGGSARAAQRASTMAGLTGSASNAGETPNARHPKRPGDIIDV